MKKENNSPEKIKLDSAIALDKHSNLFLMENLKSHLKYLEEKHDLNARTAGMVALSTTFATTVLAAGAGMAYLTQGSLPIDIPSAISFGSTAGACSVAAIISGIISHNQSKKAEKYRYFRRLSSAGVEDSKKLEEAKTIIKNNGTLEEVKDKIMQKRTDFTPSRMYLDL